LPYDAVSDTTQHQTIKMMNLKRILQKSQWPTCSIWIKENHTILH